MFFAGLQPARTYKKQCSYLYSFSRRERSKRHYSPFLRREEKKEKKHSPHQTSPQGEASCVPMVASEQSSSEPGSRRDRDFLTVLVSRDTA